MFMRRRRELWKCHRVRECPLSLSLMYKHKRMTRERIYSESQSLDVDYNQMISDSAGWMHSRWRHTEFKTEVHSYTHTCPWTHTHTLPHYLPVVVILIYSVCSLRPYFSFPLGSKPTNTADEQSEETAGSRHVEVPGSTERQCLSLCVSPWERDDGHLWSFKRTRSATGHHAPVMYNSRNPKSVTQDSKWTWTSNVGDHI